MTFVGSHDLRGSKTYVSSKQMCLGEEHSKSNRKSSIVKDKNFFFKKKKGKKEKSNKTNAL